MSRPTEFQMAKQANQTPTPLRYDTTVTNSGHKLIGAEGISALDQVRGTFGNAERFRDYKANAYVRSNPQVGPGAHEDHANFRKLKDKPCKVMMMPQQYHVNWQLTGELLSRSARSRRSRTSSGSAASSQKRLSAVRRSAEKRHEMRFHQGGRVSSSPSRSASKGRLQSGPLSLDKDEYQYVRSGNLLQRSPMQDDLDKRLNYDIYKQDSFRHRHHLLDIIKKKQLKKQKKRITVSYRPAGQNSFKVGYGGQVKHIYASNPDTYLSEVKEEKRRRREAQRQSMIHATLRASQPKPRPQMQEDVRPDQIHRINRELQAQMQRRAAQPGELQPKGPGGLQELAEAQEHMLRLDQDQEVLEAQMPGRRPNEGLVDPQVIVPQPRAPSAGQQALRARQAQINRPQRNANRGAAYSGKRSGASPQAADGPTTVSGSASRKSTQPVALQTANLGLNCSSFRTSIVSNNYQPILAARNRGPNQSSQVSAQRPPVPAQNKKTSSKTRPKSAKDHRQAYGDPNHSVLGRNYQWKQGKQPLPRPATGSTRPGAAGRNAYVMRDSETNGSNAQFIIQEEDDQNNALDAEIDEINHSPAGVEKAAAAYGHALDVDKTKKQKRLMSAKTNMNPRGGAPGGGMVANYYDQIVMKNMVQGAKRSKRPVSGKANASLARQGPKQGTLNPYFSQSSQQQPSGGPLPNKVGSVQPSSILSHTTSHLPVHKAFSSEEQLQASQDQQNVQLVRNLANHSSIDELAMITEDAMTLGKGDNHMIDSSYIRTFSPMRHANTKAGTLGASHSITDIAKMAQKQAEVKQHQLQRQMARPTGKHKLRKQVNMPVDAQQARYERYCQDLSSASGLPYNQGPSAGPLSPAQKAQGEKGAAKPPKSAYRNLQNTRGIVPASAMMDQFELQNAYAGQHRARDKLAGQYSSALNKGMSRQSSKGPMNDLNIANIYDPWNHPAARPKPKRKKVMRTLRKKLSTGEIPYQMLDHHVKLSQAQRQMHRATFKQEMTQQMNQPTRELNDLPPGSRRSDGRGGLSRETLPQPAPSIPTQESLYGQQNININVQPIEQEDGQQSEQRQAHAVSQQEPAKGPAADRGREEPALEQQEEAGLQRYSPGVDENAGRSLQEQEEDQEQLRAEQSQPAESQPNEYQQSAEQEEQPDAPVQSQKVEQQYQQQDEEAQAKDSGLEGKPVGSKPSAPAALPEVVIAARVSSPKHRQSRKAGEPARQESAPRETPPKVSKVALKQAHQGSTSDQNQQLEKPASSIEAKPSHKKQGRPSNALPKQSPQPQADQLGGQSRAKSPAQSAVQSLKSSVQSSTVKFSAYDERKQQRESLHAPSQGSSPEKVPPKIAVSPEKQRNEKTTTPRADEAGNKWRSGTHIVAEYDSLVTAKGQQTISASQSPDMDEEKQQSQSVQTSHKRGEVAQAAAAKRGSAITLVTDQAPYANRGVSQDQSLGGSQDQNRQQTSEARRAAAGVESQRPSQESPDLGDSSMVAGPYPSSLAPKEDGALNQDLQFDEVIIREPQTIQEQKSAQPILEPSTEKGRSREFVSHEQSSSFKMAPSETASKPSGGKSLAAAKSPAPSDMRTVYMNGSKGNIAKGAEHASQEVRGSQQQLRAGSSFEGSSMLKSAQQQDQMARTVQATNAIYEDRILGSIQTEKSGAKASLMTEQVCEQTLGKEQEDEVASNQKRLTERQSKDHIIQAKASTAKKASADLESSITPSQLTQKNVQFERVIEAAEEPVAVEEESIGVQDVASVPREPAQAKPDEVAPEQPSRGRTEEAHGARGERKQGGSRSRERKAQMESIKSTGPNVKDKQYKEKDPPHTQPQPPKAKQYAPVVNKTFQEEESVDNARDGQRKKDQPPPLNPPKTYKSSQSQQNASPSQGGHGAGQQSYHSVTESLQSQSVAGRADRPQIQVYEQIQSKPK